MCFRRWVILPLVVLFLAWGTGTLDYLHNIDHLRQDAKNPSAPLPVHDDSNCVIHAMLHVPMAATQWVPLLICLGLFIAFLSLLESLPVSLRAVWIQACRGPPIFR
jgi:hypothetical protein